MKNIGYTIAMALLFSMSMVDCKKCQPTTENQVDSTITTDYSQYGIPLDSVAVGRDMRMYEVNLRAFSASGDFQGVINRLDELDSLNINVIWLMPIHPIGVPHSVNSPYSVQDYKAVSPEYGDLEDLRNLITQAHSRGMAVILDWVANHTAWDNPWITSHPDWYTQDANGNIISPAGTNWLDVADLNFDNQEMRTAMIDAMRYWVLQANVDGFRCDHADGVPNDFWQSAIDNLRGITNRKLIFLAEGAGAELLSAGFDMNFGWDFYNGLKNAYNGSAASTLLSIHNSEYTAIPLGKHKLRFTTNHDESAWDASPVSLFGGTQGAMTASAISIFTGGIPLIYTGQEVGRSTTTPFFSNSPIDWSAHPEMKQFYRGLMKWYKSNEAVKKGFVAAQSNTNVFALKKNWNGHDAMIIANIRNASQTLAIPANWQGTYTNAITGMSINLGSSITIDAYDNVLLYR
jgi:glycosidase